MQVTLPPPPPRPCYRHHPDEPIPVPDPVYRYRPVIFDSQVNSVPRQHSPLPCSRSHYRQQQRQLALPSGRARTPRHPHSRHRHHRPHLLWAAPPHFRPPPACWPSALLRNHCWGRCWPRCSGRSRPGPRSQVGFGAWESSGLGGFGAAPYAAKMERLRPFVLTHEKPISLPPHAPYQAAPPSSSTVRAAGRPQAGSISR